MEDRKGYCAWCKYVDCLSKRIKEEGKHYGENKCDGCWFTEDKPNWEYYLKDDGNV